MYKDKRNSKLKLADLAIEKLLENHVRLLIK